MQTETRLSGDQLATPMLVALLLAMLAAYMVLFDQGALLAPVTHALSDSGGVLHEFFHDARHLFGVPCH